MLPLPLLGCLMSSNVAAPVLPVLPGQVFDFDPNDATTLTLVGSAISSAADAQGGAVVLTQGTSGKRPAVDTVTTLCNGRATAHFTKASASKLASASGGCATASSPYLFLCIYKDDDVANVGSYLAVQGMGGAQTVEYGFVTPRVMFASVTLLNGWGTDPTTGDGRASLKNTTSWRVFGEWYDGTTRRVIDDGEIYQEIATSWTTLTSSLTLGEIAGNPCPDMNVARAVWCADSTLSDYATTVAAIDAWMRKAAVIYGLGKEPAVQCDGDSMTFGLYPHGSPTSTGGYPSYMDANSLLNGGNATIRNTGLTNQTTAGLLARLNNTTILRYSALRSANAYVCWIGINDLFAATTPAAAYANIVSACAAASARGFRTFVITHPFVDFPTEEAARQTLIGLIRAGEGVDFDALIDVAALTEFQSLTSYYYQAGDQDGLHLGDTGYYLVGDTAAPIINAEMGWP